MKRIILVGLMVCSALGMSAQSRSFDGVWTGSLKTDEGNEFNVTLYVEDNNVYSVTTDEEGDRIKDTDYEVIWSKGYGEQLNYTWMNKGGVWTETQTYSLVYVNNSKLSVHFLRHVSNQSEEYDGNTDWGYFATGYLYKEE